MRRGEIVPRNRDSALSPPQDYRWWWRNFLVSGGSAFYVLVYAIFYFVNKVLPGWLVERRVLGEHPGV